MTLIDKKQIFDLTKNSSIWMGVITLLILLGDKLFSQSISNETTYLILGLIFLSLLFQGYLIVSAVRKDFFDRIKDLESFIEDKGLDKIVSEKNLSFMELVSEEFWIFTKDLKNDIGFDDGFRNKEIFESVSQNISSGKKFVYFIPNTSEVRGFIKKFKQLHKTVVKNQVTFVYINSNHFHFISETVIYNPHNHTTCKGVQWFPDNTVNYYIGLDDEHVNKLLGIGTWLLENDDITKKESY